MIIILVLIFFGVFFYKTSYLNWMEEQHAEDTFKITPQDIYEESNYNKCGTWYGDDRLDEDANVEALKCWEESFAKCDGKAILGVNEFLATEEHGAVREYSLLRVLGENDAGECVLQNSYFYKIEEQEIPEMWINTCIEPDKENIWRSCMPDLMPEKLS